MWLILANNIISHLISGGLPFPLEMLSLGIYLGVGVVNIITLSYRNFRVQTFGSFVGKKINKIKNSEIFTDLRQYLKLATSRAQNEILNSSSGIFQILNSNITSGIFQVFAPLNYSAIR